MKKPIKLTVAGLTDPICPTCKTEMFAISEMVLGQNKKFTNYAQCPDCNYKTEAK